jgi:hypothetical protein
VVVGIGEGGRVEGQYQEERGGLGFGLREIREQGSSKGTQLVSVSVSLGVTPKGKANRGSKGFGEKWKERGGGRFE